MFLRIALGACLALSLALGAAVWRVSALSKANAALEASVAAHEAARDQLEEAIAVHRAHLERLTAERQAQVERVNQIEALEGGDAPLSDFMRDGAAIVWP